MKNDCDCGTRDQALIWCWRHGYLIRPKKPKKLPEAVRLESTVCKGGKYARARPTELSPEMTPQDVARRPTAHIAS